MLIICYTYCFHYFCGLRTFILLKTRHLDISKYIHELILTNECIIIPGFGGFETSYKPADIDPVTKRIQPPTKTITFQPDYTTGQGVINDLLVAKLGLSPSEAEEELGNFIESLYSTIGENGFVELTDIGRLYLDENGKIAFKQIEENNYLADSFGLEAISFKKKKDPEPSDEEVEALLKPIIHQERKYTSTYVTIGVLVVLILFTIVFIITERYNLNLFPFSLLSKKETNEVIVIGGAEKDTTDLTAKYIENQLREATEVKQALLYIDSGESKPVQRYHLVAGSFKHYANARELEKELQASGLKITIIERGEYYRVVLGSYTDKSAALKGLQEVRQKIDQPVWILDFPI